MFNGGRVLEDKYIDVAFFGLFVVAVAALILAVVNRVAIDDAHPKVDEGMAGGLNTFSPSQRFFGYGDGQVALGKGAQADIDQLGKLERFKSGFSGAEPPVFWPIGDVDATRADRRVTTADKMAAGFVQNPDGTWSLPLGLGKAVIAQRLLGDPLWNNVTTDNQALLLAKMSEGQVQNSRWYVDPATGKLALLNPTENFGSVLKYQENMIGGTVLSPY